MSVVLLARTEAVSRRLRPYWMAFSGGAVVSAVMALRVVLFVKDASDRYIAAVPDDAFYYFQLARNFSATHTWTFDGTAPATGFHPLYAYFLVGLHAVAGDLDPRSLLVVIGTVSAVAFGITATLTGATATQLFGSRSVPIVVGVFMTPVALMQTTLLVETWMVALAAAATVFFVNRTRTLNSWRVLGLLALGILGSSARTDYVVLPVAITLGYLVTRRATGSSAGLRRSVVVMAGAVIGLTLDALQNFVISGDVLQSSVRIKAFWTSVETASVDPSMRLPGSFGVSLSVLVETVTPYLGGNPIVVYEGTLAVVAGFGFVLWRVLHQRPSTMAIGSLPLIVGSGVGLLGYVVLYQQDWAALQLWYASSFLVPGSIVLASICRALFDRWLLAVASIVAAGYCLVGITHLTNTPYRNQIADLQAGLALKTMTLDGPVGAWNAGIIGYVSQRHVVNLDGLVNDDAVPYILDGRLDDYLAVRHIRYIADFDLMLDDPSMRRRGGYDNPRLKQCLVSPTSITSPGVRWGGTSYHLWQVNRECW